MILELHDNTLHLIPAEPITVEIYYAMDYVSQSSRNITLVYSMVEWNYKAMVLLKILILKSLESSYAHAKK